MNAADQRIALAKLDGWTVIVSKDIPGSLWPKEIEVTTEKDGLMLPPGLVPHVNRYGKTFISEAAGLPPDYLNDANALRALRQKVISDHKECQWAYIDVLSQLTQAGWTDAFEEVYLIANATPKQQAEAILRATGEWTQPKADLSPKVTL